jgi:KDO2-lipid IV(A) lauroyltransferase
MSLGALQRFAGGVGTLAWYLLKERRQVAKVNAKIVTLSADSDKIAKESFRQTFMAYFETAYVQNVDQDFIDKYVTVEGFENYKKIQDEGKMFSLISAHIGSWDLSSPITQHVCGFKLLVVGRESNNKALNRLLDDIRNMGDIEYATQKGFLEKAAQYDRVGCAIGSILDHGTTKGDSVVAPFFGYRVPTLAGIAALSARKKIPMLPTYLIRTKTGFKLIMHPPIYPNQELKAKDRITDLVTRMNIDFESIIKEYPEQWYLLHKRFKRLEEADGTITSNRLYRP